ncbi:hypothetical protein GIB67_002546 [Kingdonia uniflora]|uniref:RNase H type-1 domain-containing protein n=1 Tax=Kingdonia uniflora TaxID=39325 RepID=A0A7J7N8I2_9MAGN|nr:hypothetical protein GIB67_002546 [Kingdonia uniflora]
MSRPHYLFFDDDIIIFVNGHMKGLKQVMTLLDNYQAAAGQWINKNKSKLFLGSMTISRQKRGNPGSGDYGIVFRDDMEMIIEVSVKNTGVSTSYMAKCEGILAAIEKACSLDLFNLFIETGSKAAAEAYKNNGNP